MKKKLLILIPCLIILMLVAFFAGTRFYHTGTKPTAQKPNVYNIYEQPSVKQTTRFPADKPQFVAQTSTVKTKTINQSGITISTISDTKSPVFKRHFYDDFFHGDTLTYSTASDAAAITQTGTLASFGCSAEDCQFPWTNFYTWDADKKQFLLDNASHQEAFQQLLTIYQTMDQKGCGIAGDNVIPEQKGLSFTELYRKFPNITSYCSKDPKLVTFSELYYFLEAKKIVQEIVDGQNLGSRDIKDTDI
jgi:hypothetical protein